jgi:hypothetical protein
MRPSRLSKDQGCLPVIGRGGPRLMPRFIPALSILRAAAVRLRGPGADGRQAGRAGHRQPELPAPGEPCKMLQWGPALSSGKPHTQGPMAPGDRCFNEAPGLSPVRRGKQGESGASIRMRSKQRDPGRGAWSGGRGRPDRKRVLHAAEDRTLPGRHITDCRMRLYMSFRQAETPIIAAARAGFSTATAHRIEQDPGFLRKAKRHAVAGGMTRWPRFGTARWFPCSRAPLACGRSVFSMRSAGAIPRSAPASGQRRMVGRARREHAYLGTGHGLAIGGSELHRDLVRL